MSISMKRRAVFRLGVRTCESQSARLLFVFTHVKVESTRDETGGLFTRSKQNETTKEKRSGGRGREKKKKGKKMIVE